MIYKRTEANRVEVEGEQSISTELEKNMLMIVESRLVSHCMNSFCFFEAHFTRQRVFAVGSLGPPCVLIRARRAEILLRMGFQTPRCSIRSGLRVLIRTTTADVPTFEPFLLAKIHRPPGSVRSKLLQFV